MFVAMLEAYHKLQPKAKKILQLKDALQLIWIACKNPVAKNVNNFCK